VGVVVDASRAWGFDEIGFFTTAAVETRRAANIRCRLAQVQIRRLWKSLQDAKMVYYFTSNTVSPDAFIYVGKDKVESKSLHPFE
jgi:hypothetical protein